MVKLNKGNLEIAANLLKRGKLVAIPTETVYGLAANALDGEAVSRIFTAKGRPQDNPLIVHIADISEIDRLVTQFPNEARVLTDKFWPGPLTIILPKTDIIPKEVSAGLSSVAIRMPAHTVAREIIKLAGVPLAAPSANRSGSPSPTNINHVIEDMDGRIEAVVDGGICSVGVESTVVSFAEGRPKILRPGAVTAEEIINLIGDVEIDKAVYEKLDEKTKPSSPGMKYKHYSPKAEVIMVEGEQKQFINFIKERIKDNVYALCYNEDVSFIGENALSYGGTNDYAEQARRLFASLRKLDEMGAKVVYARAPKRIGIGLAVYNRLIRASGFNIINLNSGVKKW